MDSGSEFKGVVAKLCQEHGTKLVRVEAGNHNRQGIVERFNRTLSERLFGQQYAKELATGKISREWVIGLQRTIRQHNNERTRLLNFTPNSAAVKQLKPVKKEVVELKPELSLGGIYRY